jgi:galactonate dehydratase
MKITDLKTFVVATPPPHFGGRYFVFLKLVTDDGVEGLGEVYSLPFHPDVVTRMIEDVFGRYVQGANPFRIEQLWRRVYSSGYSQRPDISIMGILSGIEMACWDLVGKAVNRPVYDLLGGLVNERLRTYTYLYPKPTDIGNAYMDPELAAARAAEYVNWGFTAVKFDPLSFYSAFDPRQPSLEALDHVEKYIKLVREAVGNRCDLLFGTHGQLTPGGALRLASRLEPYEPLWFEEPVPPERPEMMAEVAAGTRIPIATGERLATKYEFARVLETRAASILQMNLGRVGGILEAKKIAGMAEAYYAQIAPHLYCGPVVGAANIHLSACIPNFLILESIQTWGGFQSELLETPIRWEAGYVIPPDGPGLGIELNETVAGQHPYTDNALHLSMVDDPVI